MRRITRPTDVEIVTWSLRKHWAATRPVGGVHHAACCWSITGLTRDDALCEWQDVGRFDTAPWCKRCARMLPPHTPQETS